MKKVLVLILLIIGSFLPVFSDTMPFYVNTIPDDAIGLFQTDETLKVYLQPDEKSQVVKEFKFSYNPESMPDSVFAVLINDNKLGFVYVTDIEEDGWVKVLYDKQTKAHGWVKTKDSMQFLPWVTFYNLYGRKYGLRLLKDAPEETKVLHARSEDLSQSISKLNYIKSIKLTAIRGNWALVSVYDIEKTPKTGFLKWRSSDGIIYAFPDIK